MCICWSDMILDCIEVGEQTYNSFLSRPLCAGVQWMEAQRYPWRLDFPGVGGSCLDVWVIFASWRSGWGCLRGFLRGVPPFCPVCMCVRWLFVLYGKGQCGVRLVSRDQMSGMGSVAGSNYCDYLII
jgi:hypothetical protein